MKRNKLIQKCITCVIAGSLAVNSAAAVQAASYRETEKNALKKLANELAESLDQDISDSGASRKTAAADLTLKLDNSGRSILGFLIPTDISWFDHVGMNMNVSIQDGMEIIAGNLSMNDTPITPYEIFLDPIARKEYISFPDIVDGYLYTDLTEDMSDVDEIPLSPETMAALFEDPMALFPGGTDFGQLLDRYGSIIIDHMTEGFTETGTVLTAGGVSEDCTMYEGRMHLDGIAVAMAEILETMKDDEQVRSLIENWNDLIPEAGISYDEFQNSLEELLKEVKSTDLDDMESGAFISKIWVNNEGSIIGRQFSINDGTENIPVFSWIQTENNGAVGFLAEISGGSAADSVTLSGSGENSSGKLNGTYRLSAAGQSLVNIEVTDYEADEEGNMNGTFTLSFAADSSPEMAALANMNLIVNLTADAASQNAAMSASLSSAGSSLGTLTVNCAPGENPDIPQFQASAPMYNVTSDEDMNTCLSLMNFDKLLENCRSAGITEEIMEILEQGIQSLQNPAEVSPDYSDDNWEDYGDWDDADYDDDWQDYDDWDDTDYGDGSLDYGSGPDDPDYGDSSLDYGSGPDDPDYGDGSLDYGSGLNDPDYDNGWQSTHHADEHHDEPVHSHAAA